MADEAVKTGKVKIQDAVDFYDWARKNENSSSVSYRFYSKEEYSDAGKFLERKYKDVKAVPNTMKIHSVAAISAEQVKVKETSGYCDQCLTGEDFKGSSTYGWKAVTVRNEVTGSLDGRLAIRVNDWVAADYEGAWYIGQVQQIDEQDGEVEVSFMTEGKGKTAASSFKWPTQKDVLWLERKSILCVIEAPVPVGKTGRAFKLTEATIELIEQRHGNYKF